MTKDTDRERRRLNLNRQQMFRKVRATLGGYFWLPCPRCGTMFGGHEAVFCGWTTPDAAPGIHKGVCPPCGREIRASNMAEYGQPDVYHNVNTIHADYDIEPCSCCEGTGYVEKVTDDT